VNNVGIKAMSVEAPDQAVILAGGLGTRLLPLTRNMPKPMILFHGKPFLEYLIELLREQGIRRILLLLGHLPEKVMDYFGDGRRFGVKIAYNVSPVKDETGMRMKRAVDRMDEVFLFLYCDNYVPFQYSKMWKLYQEQKVPALVTIYDNKDGYTKSNIRIDESGRVDVYDKTRTAENLQGVDIGFMIMRRDILDLMPDGNVSFEKTVYPKLVEKRQLHAYVNHHRYYSVGDLKRLPLTEAFFARERVVLIDRDGVLNKKMPQGEYVSSWADWEWLNGALDGLRLLYEKGYRCVLISNQAGIARGMIEPKALEEIHDRMKQEVADHGGRIDAIYVCPHHWDEGCFCRKPNPGMLFSAQKDFHFDLSKVVFIGDDERDGIAANAAGCTWAEVKESQSLFDIAQQLSEKVSGSPV